jgi:hypothetical protein
MGKEGGRGVLKTHLYASLIIAHRSSLIAHR